MAPVAAISGQGDHISVGRSRLGSACSQNIVAGHIMLKLFADFCTMISLSSLGAIGAIASIAPVLAVAVLFAFRGRLIVIGRRSDLASSLAHHIDASPRDAFADADQRAAACKQTWVGRWVTIR